MAKTIFKRRDDLTIKDAKSLSQEDFIEKYSETTNAKANVLSKFWEETNDSESTQEKKTVPSKAVKAKVVKAVGSEKADEPIEMEVNQEVNKKLQDKQNDKDFAEFVAYLEEGDGLTDEKLQELSGDDQLLEAFVEYYSTLEPDSEEEDKRMATYEHLFSEFGTMIKTEVFKSTVDKKTPAKKTTSEVKKKATSELKKSADKKPAATKKEKVATTDGAPSKRDIIRSIINDKPECDNRYIKDQLKEQGIEKVYDSEIYAVRKKLAAEAAAEK